jgi:hypothetical protein
VREVLVGEPPPREQRAEQEPADQRSS